jgi:hypothetical protein
MAARPGPPQTCRRIPPTRFSEAGVGGGAVPLTRAEAAWYSEDPPVEPARTLKTESWQERRGRNLQDPPGRESPARGESGIELSDGEFDPGSGRTLAACLKHASRAGVGRGATRGFSSSGERVSNTWVTCPEDGDNLGKPGLIPDTLLRGHPWGRKGLGASPSASGWARGLSACWWGNGPPRR